MRLRAGVRLVQDRVTGQHVLVAPERGLVLDATAHAIVALIIDGGGERTLEQIVDVLAAGQGAGAPREVVLRDVSAFIDALAARRMVIP